MKGKEERGRRGESGRRRVYLLRAYTTCPWQKKGEKRGGKGKHRLNGWLPSPFL